MPKLTGVSITFTTHDDNKDFDTVLHVFVKNRLNTTDGSDQNNTFISNLLASQRYLDTGDLGDRAGGPYLAYGIGLAADQEFDDPSTHTFDLTLMPDPVTLDDIVLPAVNVHIVPNGNDRWIFDYTVTFSFDDNTSSTFSSSDAGLPGVILDQDNKNYSGICAELRPLPAPARPVTKSFLRKVTLDFVTHNDNKDGDTRLDVAIVNRLDATSSTAIAVGFDLFSGEEFTDGGPVHSVSWPSDDGNLTLNEIDLADMVLPEVNITISPNGNDRWIFDYRVTFEFADPDDFEEKHVRYSSRTSGVILDQDNNKHSGVYQGPSFPMVVARSAPTLVSPAPGDIPPVKTIPLALVRQKLDDFINNRNGAVSDHNPPLLRFRLHNGGKFNNGTIPENYLDVRAITAGRETVNYVSNPASLGQVEIRDVGVLYLQDINSSALSVTADDGSPGIFTLQVDFETDGPEEVVGGLLDLDFLQFSVAVKLTLAPGSAPDEQGTVRNVVDALHWVAELQDLDKNKQLDHIDTETGTAFFRYTGTFLGQPVDVVSSDSAHDLFIEQGLQVSLTTANATDPGGFVRQFIRDLIFQTLTKKDALTGRTPVDGINSMATSWLVGGVADNAYDVDGNNIVVNSVKVEDDNLVISFTGPQKVFAFQTPADWPTRTNPNPAWDFTPGTLSNIDHIVVLMMENRSFDHMLGYLSLPAAQGGAGRTDIDGLKGGESNPFRGTTFPSVPVTDTFFSPVPPHGFEPVTRAIDGGAMDGFASEYAGQNGAGVAGQIMGHQTASTVPVLDALARDFAVGHRWFASHPGPTIPNRFYELSGRPNLDSNGFWEFDTPSPILPAFTKTIFDYLSAATDANGQPQPVSWTYFEQGYTFLRLFERYTFDNQNIVTIDDPDRGFFAMAQAGTLPSVTFIDPHFVELPPDSNDDDPPGDVKNGQAFIQRVVEAVVASPAWDKTLFVMMYDEHGGFYDHVPPAAAARVSPDLPIDTHGVRVPAFVISPWVAGGTVFGSDAAPVQASPGVVRRNDLHFDHTSILRTIARRFLSADPPYLGARYAAANDLSSVVGTQLRQTQFLPFLRYGFQFNATSQMTLGIKDANPAPGAQVWQLPADGSTAQDFSFEATGDGFFYIRSHVSGLYLTVHVPAPASASGGQGSIPQPVPPTVIQDVKVVPGATSLGAGPADAAAADAVPLPAVARQQWLLVPVPVSPTLGPDLFLVESRATPGMVLQPSDPTQAGPVVLRGIAAGHPLRLNPWKITSPALSG
jgi:phospholipase C